ncbi:MAG: hypothetical protein FWD01_05410 [Defluviitaleaceae bacterium]|nr:hypothetical protein [Defluviitaleaceae bacterium]
MNRKKVLCALIAAYIFILGSFAVFAGHNILIKNQNGISRIFETIGGLQSRFFMITTTYVPASGWSNVVTDNNWLDATLEITNHADNAGDLEFRVLNENGAIIMDSFLIPLGSTTTAPKKIPFNSGTYSLQARAVSAPANYTITVKD